jgi:MYXO-CTERM domain-containing protein
VAKPEILAPGAFVGSAVSNDADPRTNPGSMFDNPACKEGDACYLVADRYGLALGTSMSTPVVSGAAALLFEQNPSLTQAAVTEILQASARYPQGNIDPPALMGAGAIDLRQALKVLATEPMAEPPDVGQSWWVLGSGNARPDRSYLIEGTIQLRRGDATVASGLDGSLIRVEVENGYVARSVLKKRHGLFSFAVAGVEGTGGSEMKVRVLYDGQQIGQEAVLPIGVDAWATGPFTADGGCTCEAAGASRRSSGAFALVALGAALTALRRRPFRPRA